MKRLTTFCNGGTYCAKVTLVSFFLFLCTPEPGITSQIDSGTYFRLQKGMSEGEVLIRAGPPDKEIYFDSEAQRTVESLKQLLYIPGPDESDPHLTVITLQKGRVVNIERTKIFSPPRKTTGGQIDSATYSRLSMGMSEGEVLTQAGSPDKEFYLGSEIKGESDSIKQLLYLPGPDESDPHLTGITLKKGKVINLERTKLFSR